MPQQVAIPLEKRKMANYGPKKAIIRRMKADEQLSVNGLIPFDRSYLLWDELALKLDGNQHPNWQSVASLLGFPYDLMNWIPNFDRSAGMTPCLKFFDYYVKNWSDQSVQSMMVALWQAGLYDALKILEEEYPSIDVKQIAQDKGLSQDVFIPKKVEELDDAPHFIKTSGILFDGDGIPLPPGHEHEASIYQEAPLDLRSPVNLRRKHNSQYVPSTPSPGNNFGSLTEDENESEMMFGEDYPCPVQDMTIGSTSTPPTGGAFHRIGSQIRTLERNHPNNIQKPNGSLVQPLRRRRPSPSEPEVKRPNLGPSSQQVHITSPNIVGPGRELMRAPDDLEIVEHRYYQDYHGHDLRHTTNHEQHGARPETNNHNFPASHHPAAMYHFSGLVHPNNINKNNGEIHQYGHKDSSSNPGMDIKHSLVHDIQPMFNGQGRNQPSVIRGDCENPRCQTCFLIQSQRGQQVPKLQNHESPKAVPLSVPNKELYWTRDVNYNDADVADIKYRKQEKVEFITHKENEHHCAWTKNLPVQHNHVQTEHGEQSHDLEDHHYACISRTYPGCKSHSRSPLDDMAAMRQELARTVSQQDCKMAEFKIKNPTKIRICVLAMDDLTMESRKSFHDDLRTTQYSDVVFCPVFVSHKDDQKRIQTYLEKSDTIIWCGSAKLKQMLEGTLSTANKYNLLRYAFHKSLRYKNKLIRVVFPEQPNSQETFPLQVIYEGKLFMYRGDWDDLTYYLRQPKQVMEKIAKTYQNMEMMGKKPHKSKF